MIGRTEVSGIIKEPYYESDSSVAQIAVQSALFQWFTISKMLESPLIRKDPSQRYKYDNVN